MYIPLVRPIAFSDEAPGSLLLRSSSFNHSKKVTFFLSAYCSSKIYDESGLIALFTQQKKWIYICKAIAVKNANHICYSKTILTKEKINFLRNEVLFDELRLKSPRVCPSCLREKAYIPKIWDYNLITSCSIHGLELIKTCPKCLKDISWNRQSLNICQCGNNLANTISRFTGTKSSQFIEKLLNEQNGHVLKLLNNLTSAFKILYKLALIEKKDYEIVDDSISVIKSQDYFENIFSKQIRQIIINRNIHPRLLLWPFLCSSEILLNDFANNILKLIENYNFKSLDSPSLSELVNFSEASMILGLGRSRIVKIMKMKLVKANKNKSSIYIALEDINNLLLLCSQKLPLNENYSKINVLLNSKVNNFNFNVFLEIIKNSSTKIGNMKITSGLLTTQIEYFKKQPNTIPNSYLSIKEMANLCNVHYENIRFAVHANIIKRVDPSLTKGTQIFIKKKDALDFHEKYVFSGALAKELNTNATNLAEKIKAFNVLPISGSGIDNGLINIFERSSLSNLNFKDVINLKNYPTKTGRKKNVHTKIDSSIISLSESAKKLSISIEKAKKLCNKGLLIKVDSKSRNVNVTLESVSKIKDIIHNKELVTISQAAKQTNESISTFLFYWVRTQYISLINIYIEKYITRQDLDKVLKFKEIYISGRECGERLGTHRSFLANLEKRNLITPSQILFYNKKAIKFYKHEDIQAILSQNSSS